MPRGLPETMIEFQRRFPDDSACWTYLASCRWPEGYRCPRCGGGTAALLTTRRLWQCSACRYQVSVTAGTVLHKTRTPLHLWFWAAYLVTATPGVSALQLQRQLGLGRYETAWTMLHKLRRGMAAPERDALQDRVEVGKCWIRGHTAGQRGRTPDSKELVAIAVEVRGTGTGRIRMSVIGDASPRTFCRFVADNVTTGAVVHTDGWPAYRALARRGYRHRPGPQLVGRLVGRDDEDILPRVHRVIRNLKTWLPGTYRGVSGEHLQVYLDEYSFRFNRCRDPMAAFHSLLGLSSQRQVPPVGVEPTLGPF
jgi:transposase-like protein